MIIELTAIAPTGEAIGRHEGFVIFVPFGLPGERVEIEIVHRRKRYARGRLLKVLTPSPHRVTPPCRYFMQCGGCEWQHMDYASQLEFKTASVREQLVRIGKFDAPKVLDCLPSPQPYHYRNHTQMALSTKGRLGYYATGSNDIVEIAECPIIDESLNELIASEISHPDLSHIIESLAQPGSGLALQEVHLRAGVNTSERMLVFEMHSTGTAQPAPIETYAPLTASQSAIYAEMSVSVAITVDNGSAVAMSGQPYIHERVGDFRYAISPSSFFQVNTHTADLLVHEVLNVMAPYDGEPVLDLFCGTGLFTLPISTRASRVVGIESSAQAVCDARLNLAEHDNVKIIQSDVATALVQSEIRDQRWAVIVMDPPRAGLSGETLNRIIALNAARLVYVSCDAATLARDAAIFAANSYRLMHVQPIDMFPQTHHVENVALLEYEIAHAG